MGMEKTLPRRGWRLERKPVNSDPDPSPPTVSVLLPVHNAARYVSATIQSVLDQTWTDFEFLITDDGSTDASADIIRQATRHDPRVHFRQQANAGFAETLNRMLEVARGKYLARIDADDMAYPLRFAEQVHYLDSHPEVAVVGTAVMNIDRDGDSLGSSLFPVDHDAIESSLLAGSGGIIHPSTMIRGSAMRQVGGYASDLPIVEDQDLWLRLARVGRLANLEGVLLKYRVHDENMSFTGTAEAAANLRIVLQRACRERGLPAPAENKVIGQSPVSSWERRRTWAWTAVGQHQVATARKHANRLVLERPWDIQGWKLWVAACCPWILDKIRRNRGNP